MVTIHHFKNCLLKHFNTFFTIVSTLEEATNMLKFFNAQSTFSYFIIRSKQQRTCMYNSCTIRTRNVGEHKNNLFFLLHMRMGNWCTTKTKNVSKAKSTCFVLMRMRVCNWCTTRTRNIWNFKNNCILCTVYLLRMCNSRTRCSSHKHAKLDLLQERR